MGDTPTEDTFDRITLDREASDRDTLDQEAMDRDTLDQKSLDSATREALEAAAFRRLIGHLQKRTDVQNIDVMNLAGFCRNCLARWYQEAAEARGVQLSKEEARETIYGMPYDAWKKKHQT